MKTRISSRTASTAEGDHIQRRATSVPRAAAKALAGEHSSAAQLQASDRMVAQRQQVEAAFGAAVQRQEGPEEELQMKVAQRMAPEEEMPLQGKFDVAQRAAEDDEEPLQGRFEAVQRQAGPEEEEPLQGRFANGGGTVAQAKSEPNATGMPDHLKSGLESLSGMDMSAVRVHANSDRPAQLNAHAYAQGNDIHLAPGQEQHLPHEAWHVVQQRQGRVQATTQVQGVGVNDDHSLESEADQMGARALASGSESKE